MLNFTVFLIKDIACILKHNFHINVNGRFVTRWWVTLQSWVIQRSEVRVTAVTVTIGYNDGFCTPQLVPHLMNCLQIEWQSVGATNLSVPQSVTVTHGFRRIGFVNFGKYTERLQIGFGSVVFLTNCIVVPVQGLNPRPISIFQTIEINISYPINSPYQ